MNALPRWHAAISMAERAHLGQLRKDGKTPYAAHVVRVTMIVRDVFGCADEAALAAAALHDVIEDTPLDYDDIADEIGDDVAQLVATLTKNAALPEAEREPKYAAQIGDGSWRAKLVKLADTLDNLSDLGTIKNDVDGRRRRAIARAELMLEVIGTALDAEAQAQLGEPMRIVQEAVKAVRIER